MLLVVDSHNDLAWNMLSFDRDYTRAVAETRRLEAGSATVQQNGDTLLGWPEYQRGRVAVIFSTLFAAPLRQRTYAAETQVYETPEQAHRLYRDQLTVYHRLTDSHPDKFRLVASAPDLKLILDHWRGVSPQGFAASRRAADEDGHPVGMIVLMEGAEGIRSFDELAEWHELGLRMIGPAWAGTRFCGGTKEPGPLTDEGRGFLAAMQDFNFFLDLSHMDEPAALEALDRYSGPVVATHGNCRALLPDYPTNRQFTDGVIRGLIQRDGVVGVVPYNFFLKSGWTRQSSRREEVHLVDLISHIDHICQMAGDSLHVGIGSDFDGGFGLQSVPPEIDTIADLQILAPLLDDRGYSAVDVENILGKNWLTRLERELPAE